MTRIADKIKTIRDLCKKHEVKSLYVFGSVLTDKFNDESDVDFVVDFNEKPLDQWDYVSNYFALREGLQLAVGRAVDLVEDKGIRNPYFRRNVDATKQIIYGPSTPATAYNPFLRQCHAGIVMDIGDAAHSRVKARCRKYS